MTPAIPETISDPKMNHATTPIRPPVATEPNSLPNRVRRNAPPSKDAEDDERIERIEESMRSGTAEALLRLRRRQRLAIDHRR